MGYRLIETDGTGLCERYGISGLLGLFLSAADLKEEQIVELLGVPQKVRTSQAQCVKNACARIAAAAENGEKVFVGGDYDADGICSTAIMKDVLDRLGIVNGYYIPDRFREGYGLRPETVRLAHGKGYTLIITVDNGVKAHEAIEEAHRLGIEIIVTDHHRIDEQPKADILVHPDFMEEEYQYLCGAGVALQISRTLIGDCPAHIAIAAVAHIGDVMELWKQTRAIVRQGTEYLDSGTVKAFSALNERKVPFDREVIGFQIAPKLNSVGRMNDISNVNTLVPFLLSKDDRTVLSYTMQLNHVNEMRKQLSADMVRQAERMMGDDPFPVICSPDFHEGICGLAAGRLARAYHRPVLIMTDTENGIKGSGRSVKGLDLYEFFQEGFPELTAFGGHSMAVGLTVQNGMLDIFRDKVHRKYEACGFCPEEESMDYIVLRRPVSLEEAEDLQRLEPFPAELAELRFAVKDPVILNISSSTGVTRFVLKNGEGTLDAVLFPYRRLPVPEKVRLIGGRLKINEWNHRRTLQLDVDLVE